MITLQSVGSPAARYFSGISGVSSVAIKSTLSSTSSSRGWSAGATHILMTRRDRSSNHQQLKGSAPKYGKRATAMQLTTVKMQKGAKRCWQEDNQQQSDTNRLRVFITERCSMAEALFTTNGSLNVEGCSSFTENCSPRPFRLSSISFCLAKNVTFHPAGYSGVQPQHEQLSTG